MKKTVTKVLGILSITLLTSAVVTTAAAAPTLQGQQPAESRALSIIAPVPTAQVAAKPAAKPVLVVPAVTRPYKHPSMHGYKKSVYRGKYYRSSQEGWRKCVMWRESNHTYGAYNGGGSSAAGAYQFLDNSWRPGLAHMIYPELKKDYGTKVAKKIRAKLMKTPINKWSREMQDRGFFTALNYRGDWAGKHHWNATVPGTSC